MKILLAALAAIASVFTGCSSASYSKTVEQLDLQRFMGTWYVIAGRFTFLEKGAHNAVEIYRWNEAKQQIDIEFTFNKDSLAGPVKEIPQTATIFNQQTNAHWKVSPFWPLRFDYLVVAVDADYQWTAIGVPSQNYLWIMARTAQLADPELKNILTKLTELGYRTDELVYVKHDS